MQLRCVSETGIVQNLNSALSTWSEKMAELWTLLTENPATFKGGGIWRIMTNINDALTAIAYGLLVLFFAEMCIRDSSISFVRHLMDWYR